MKTCEKCRSHFPNWIIIEGKKRNLCSRKYCLECSPRGAHNTKSITSDNIQNTKTKKCTICKSTKMLSEFYINGSTSKAHSYCKSCTNRATTIRQRKIKKDAVDYLGGKCAKCGVTGDPAIFDFHHKDPRQKDFNISKKKHCSLDKIKRELDKCMLLCACCHRIVHVAERNESMNLDIEIKYLEARKGVVLVSHTSAIQHLPRE